MSLKKKYIGIKIVDAWPEKKDEQEGYAVVYKDGYESWCPKAVFEEANLYIGDSEDPNIKQKAAQALDAAGKAVRDCLCDAPQEQSAEQLPPNNEESEPAESSEQTEVKAE